MPRIPDHRSIERINPGGQAPVARIRPGSAGDEVVGQALGETIGVMDKLRDDNNRREVTAAEADAQIQVSQIFEESKKAPFKGAEKGFMEKGRGAVENIGKSITDPGLRAAFVQNTGKLLENYRLRVAGDAHERKNLHLQSEDEDRLDHFIAQTGADNLQDQLNRADLLMASGRVPAGHWADPLVSKRKFKEVEAAMRERSLLADDPVKALKRLDGMKDMDEGSKKRLRDTLIRKRTSENIQDALIGLQAGGTGQQAFALVAGGAPGGNAAAGNAVVKDEAARVKEVGERAEMAASAGIPKSLLNQRLSARMNEVVIANSAALRAAGKVEAAEMWEAQGRQQVNELRAKETVRQNDLVERYSKMINDKGGAVITALENGEFGSDWDFLDWDAQQTLKIRAGLKKPDGKMPSGALSHLRTNCEGDKQNKDLCQLYFDKYKDSMQANGNADLVKWYERILADPNEFEPQMKAITAVASEKTMQRVYVRHGMENDENKQGKLYDYALMWVEQQMRLGEKPTSAKLAVELGHMVQTEYDGLGWSTPPLYTSQEEQFLRLQEIVENHPDYQWLAYAIYKDPEYEATPPDEQPMKFWDLYTTKPYYRQKPDEKEDE